MRTWFCGLAACIVLGATGAGAQGTAPVPAAAIAPEVFYAAPDVGAAKLSPSGRWLALSAGYGGTRVALAVFDTQTMSLAGLAAKFDDVDVREFYWVNDDRLVFDLIDHQRGGGDQPRGPGLFSVERDGSDMQYLVKVDDYFVTAASRPGRNPLDPRHGLLHVPTGGGDEVIVGQWSLAGPGEEARVLPYRLNVKTRRSVPIAFGAPKNVRYWLFDPQGEPRLAVSELKGRSTVHWRDAGASEWRALAEFASLNPRSGRASSTARAGCM